eukprot:c15635_g1_i2.p1 GENE.c15635_g1_i2~~c15635_g1_i2.p1  ORF type:complete len:195 (-),score=35.50 c15635_g1_i2:97-681(-)
MLDPSNKAMLSKHHYRLKMYYRAGMIENHDHTVHGSNWFRVLFNGGSLDVEKLRQAEEADMTDVQLQALRCMVELERYQTDVVDADVSELSSIQVHQKSSNLVPDWASNVSSKVGVNLGYSGLAAGRDLPDWLEMKVKFTRVELSGTPQEFDVGLYRMVLMTESLVQLHRLHLKVSPPPTTSPSRWSQPQLRRE